MVRPPETLQLPSALRVLHYLVLHFACHWRIVPHMRIGSIGVDEFHQVERFDILVEQDSCHTLESSERIQIDGFAYIALASGIRRMVSSEIATPVFTVYLNSFSMRGHRLLGSVIHSFHRDSKSWEYFLLNSLAERSLFLHEYDAYILAQ